MPYISITTSKKLEPAVREKAARRLGELITLIPGKTEPGLMIGFVDDADLFFGGRRVDCAYVSVNLYTEAPLEAKANFAKAASLALEELTGIKTGDIYLNYLEYPNWCAGASLK